MPSGRAARIACCSCVSARSIDSERPVRFLTSGPSTFHAYCRVCPDGRSPENALRAFIESSRMFMLNVLRQRPLPGLRAHFDARTAIAAARRIVVADADFLNLRAGRQPPAGEAVDANVGVLADELLQHLRELFRIVGQRGELFRRQLLGERAEQLRVFLGRQHLDLFGERRRSPARRCGWSARRRAREDLSRRVVVNPGDSTRARSRPAAARRTAPRRVRSRRRGARRRRRRRERDASRPESSDPSRRARRAAACPGVAAQTEARQGQHSTTRRIRTRYI